ncbi:MAG: hypothetical protein R3330_06625 [Saprospiraceae bacterium]|nr:hypothetical protein [Saprospiraceae bacterium]
MISILRNIGLPQTETRNQTSTVGETSIACSPSRIFISGNWYASETTDGGLSWIHVNPARHLPAPASGGFCCDQTLVYVPGRDVMVWLLQYMSDAHENVLRLAVKGGADDNSSWHWWDFTPTQVNSAWTNEWFDYNHAALSDNFLYVGTNVFDMEDRWQRCVILRIPLDVLAGGGSLSFEYFDSNEHFSLRCTQGASSTMYCAAHDSSRRLTVYAWPEQDPDVTIHQVRVSRWDPPDPNVRGYSSPSPDGTDWLQRCDSRITAGWVSGDTIGFAWTANSRGRRKQPHVRAVRIDTSNMRRIDEPDIWNDQFAFAYPNGYPNRDGTVGLSLFLGGGTRFPSLAVGIFDEQQNRWRLRMAQQGTHGPVDNKWGDYLGCVTDAGGANWVAAGFTLQGGGARTDIEPRFVEFALQSGDPPV